MSSNLLTHSACPKCGGNWGTLKWVPVVRKLHRTCSVCGYSQSIDALDAE